MYIIMQIKREPPHSDIYEGVGDVGKEDVAATFGSGLQAACVLDIGKFKLLPVVADP
jgi:hypothetical protein